jgi:hypothetical protein
MVIPFRQQDVTQGDHVPSNPQLAGGSRVLFHPDFDRRLRHRT